MLLSSHVFRPIEPALRFFVLVAMAWCTVFVNTAYGREIVYHDLRVRSENQEYAIAFSANSGDFGHAFVTLVWGDDVVQATMQSSMGFYPGDGKKNLKIAFGSKGSLQNEGWSRAEFVFSVLVNKEAYDAAEAVVRRWKGDAPYFLGFNDCTTFVSEVAKAAGLSIPNRVFAPYPIDFVKELSEKNKN